MPAEPDRSAPAPPEAPLDLAAQLDLSRTVCLPDYDEAACSAALVALANSRGGHLILGAERDPETGRLRACESSLPHDARALLAGLAERVDPPLTRVANFRTEALDGAELVVAGVRRSVSTPHIDPISGCIFVVAGATPEPVRRRADLDRLYRRGAATEERAQRTLDGMVEQLQLASFGHYGIGVIAALLQPSAAPHDHWRHQPALMSEKSDPFVREWKLDAVEPAVRPSWIELRLERELTGVLRVTRAGCAAAAETRSLPSDKTVGSVAELHERLDRLVDAACRLLATAEDGQIVPRLLCEGLRGSRLRADPDAERLSSPAAEDSLELDGPAGDAADKGYRRDLTEVFLRQIIALYKLDGDG